MERIEAAVEDPDVLSEQVRARASINRLEGVGVSERRAAPCFTTTTLTNTVSSRR